MAENREMKQDEKKPETATEGQQDVEKQSVKLTKTYEFEGEKISEIDFSGLEDVTAKTMIKANKILNTAGDVQILPENSLHYALIIAAECTKYPIEFYEILRPNDAMKVKNTINNFFFGGTSD